MLLKSFLIAHFPWAGPAGPGQDHPEGDRVVAAAHSLPAGPWLRPTGASPHLHEADSRAAAQRVPSVLGGRAGGRHGGLGGGASSLGRYAALHGAGQQHAGDAAH